MTHDKMTAVIQTNVRLVQAIDEIDAAVFSGDTFHDHSARVALEFYLKRWEKELSSISEVEE
jgi:hypothetical protein